MLTPSPLPLPPAWLIRVTSPLGRIEIGSDGPTVTSLFLETAGTLPFDAVPENPNDVLREAAHQLDEYFAGTRRSFDLPLTLTGTEFQKQVWKQLAEIEWGEVATYGDIGLATGRPTAGRAVGGAIGANPVPLFIPCHRVLASNRRITGYSAGNGIPTKVWLLDHEGIQHVA